MSQPRLRWAWMLTVFGLLALMSSSSAMASPINDIPDAINNALFGGVSLFAAQTILTAAIMMSAGLALAVAKLPPVGIFVVLFCVLGALTAIGWASLTFIVIASFIAVGLFAKTMTQYMGGSASG